MHMKGFQVHRTGKNGNALIVPKDVCRGCGEPLLTAYDIDQEYCQDCLAEVSE